MTISEIVSVYSSKDALRFDEASEALVSQANTLKAEEIRVLASAIANSGEKIQLPSNKGPYADVPSTGAPGSLSTLLCPLLIATCGVRVPKLSAPGSVAGGIDTLGIISGYKTELWGADFLEVILRTGYAHSKPSRNFCPADKSLINVRKSRNMMACAPLAAVSLISKKLAMPGTVAAFDFRVGTTGNIGNTEAEAREAAHFFYSVAAALKFKMSVRLTDNHTFPCSALGRHESLRLLTDVVCNRELCPLDRHHLDTCLDLATDAVRLATGESREQARSEVNAGLSSGAAWQLFLEHLKAQGASEAALDEALSFANMRSRSELVAAKDGYWIPPDLDQSKDWIKEAVKKIPGREKALEPGLRLLAMPFTKVADGQPLVEIMIPAEQNGLQIPDYLSGAIADAVPEAQRFKSYLVE
jgi:pyrimidine-nucleoside phosphorylase